MFAFRMDMLRIILIISFSASGLLPGLSLTYGQSSSVPDSTKRIYHLNPVVVTAAKSPGHRMDLAASLTVLDAAELNNTGSASALTALNTLVPGFFITEWGMMGFGVAGKSAGKISLRGIGGGANTHTLILRNGRPDFMGLMGCTVADEFSPESVGRIEIVRGPGSFLYGTNATGGVINILPRTRDIPGFETWLKSGYGPYSTYEISGGHGGKAGAFDYYLTAAGRGTGGHRLDASNAYNSGHFTVHTGFSAGMNTHFELNGNYSRIHFDDPGSMQSPFTDHWYHLARYGGDLTLNHSGRLGESMVKLHANFGNHQFYDGWNSFDRILGLMIHHTVTPWSGNKTTIGFDIKEYGGDARDSKSDYQSHYLTEWAPYIHTQQMLFRWMILSAGIRIEHHELFGYELLPKAGLVIHPRPATAFRLSAAKGFRSPSIRELYFWAPANPELGPDRFMNYEAGITQHFASLLSLEGVVFRTDGSNLVQFSSPPPQWINSGLYTLYGFEFIAGLRPLSSLSLSASWSRSSLPENAYNIPAEKGALILDAKWQRFSSHMDLTYIAGRLGAEWLPGSAVPVLHDMNNYILLNMSIAYRFAAGFGIRVQLNNIFDQAYESLYGYPMPGRTWRIFATYGT